MSRVGRALLRRVDHVWDQGWFNLVGVAVVGFFLFLALTPLSAGVDSLRAQKWGVGGTLTVDRCALDEWGKGNPWWCHGTFVSSDGRLRLSGVRYESHFDEDPGVAGSPLALDARVVGPGSSKAWPPDDEWQQSLIVGTFCLVLAGMVFGWWVSPRDAAAPSPAKGRRGRTRTAQRWGGGGARRRRRGRR
ncbi:hypothetical protein [Plantactinospora endophytica]|nr:hypothetical protein [Plantactinospora endophytica]